MASYGADSICVMRGGITLRLLAEVTKMVVAYHNSEKNPHLWENDHRKCQAQGGTKGLSIAFGLG